MKVIIIAICALSLTSCVTKSSFVQTEQTGEWSVHRHQSDSIIDPLILSVCTPQNGFTFPGKDVNRKMTKVFAIESEEGHETELFILNGGESYEFNILKNDKGFSYTFDENGKLLESCEHGY